MLTEQERKELLEFVELFNKTEEGKAKIVYVDESCWSNALTRRKETVKDLFFFGTYDSSYRPYCLMEIEYNNKTYKIHEFINHVNMDSEVCDRAIEMGDKCIPVVVQEFCNPVNQRRLCEIDGVDKILKGQLMGQNQNSRYQRVTSVVNDGIDYALRTHYGHLLKSKSSILELLTLQDAIFLRTAEDVFSNSLLKDFDENKVAIKYKNADHYTVIAKEFLEEKKESISTYYPIITYDQLKDILNNIPKQQTDMTVIGLGSAGTGILDQVVRSTYLENFYIIDFDYVEGKNLRNQWYTNRDIGYTKVSQSKNKIYDIKRITPLTFNGKFQDAKLQYFKSKYVVSGFDNLTCRMELLNRCLTDFESKYLIDIRYLDYASSIYFIDLEDEKQVRYYRNLLEEDMKAFGEDKKESQEKYIETVDEMREWLKEQKVFDGTCSETKARLFGDEDMPMSCYYCTCRSQNCAKLWLEEINKHDMKIKIVGEPIAKEESSCIRENFIDIYKYSSSFVFAAIREIESGNDKPFTHIEAQTEVIPTSVVIRR